MAFKLPPEKSGWLGPEEHFSDNGDICDEPTHQPAVNSSQTRLGYRHVEPEKRDFAYLNHNQRQPHACAVSQKTPLKTEPYVVGYVANKESMSPRGYVSYPVDATDFVRRDGSVVPNDKRRDAFVYQTTTPVDFDKTVASPTPAPKVNVTVLEKNKVQIRGAHNQKPRERTKTTTCFGSRGESEGGFYYILTPKKREQEMREPIAIIDVDRYKRYENETPILRNAPAVLPISGQTYQNGVTFDGTQIANESGRNSNKLFQSILKKPFEHLPHTHYPKLSSLSPKRTVNHPVSPAAGTEQKPKTINDGQVFSSHSVRFSNDVAVNRAEVETSSAFVQDPSGSNPQELREQSLAVRPPSQPTSPPKGSRKSRGRSKERAHSPYQFTGRRVEMARNNILRTIDEEVHATYDDARDAVNKESRSDLSSGAKRVIVSRVSPPRRSHGMDLSRQTSESALSTSSKKRKRKVHRNPDSKSVVDVHENEPVELNEPREQVSKSDWTGLSTYQARRNKFGSSNNRLDMVSPDICAIRQTKVHKTFETTPLVFSTSSAEEISCRNVSCEALLRQASQKADFDGVGSPCKPGRFTRPVSAKKEESSSELPLKVIFKRPPTITKKCQTDSANQKGTGNSHHVSFNCDAGSGTHFEKQSFRADDSSQHRASLGAYDEVQRVDDDDIPTIEELNERFYTPAAVLPNPDGKDLRFHDHPPEKPHQQTKDTQTVFRSSSPGPQPIGKSQKFFNIVGPSSKARNSIESQAGCHPQSYDGLPKQRPLQCGVRHGFDESLPYEHVYSDSVRVIPNFQGQHFSNREMHGQNLNVNHCGAYNNNFENYGRKDFYENLKEWGDQDDNRDYDDYESPNGYNPDEYGNPDGYDSPDGYSPHGYESPDGYENGGGFPSPVFVGKPLGQTNNDQVVEGAWDFMKNLFRKKKHRNAAYNKRAEVSCGDCGNGMRFTLSVGMQDGAGCLVCYNRIRDDFTELLNVYKEKGYLPCDCKKALCITELVNGYMAQEKLVCTCVGDAFIDLGK